MTFNETLTPILIGAAIHCFARSIKPDGTFLLPRLNNEPRIINLGFLGTVIRALQGSAISTGIILRFANFVPGISLDTRLFFFLIAVSAGYFMFLSFAWTGLLNFLRRHNLLIKRALFAAMDSEAQCNQTDSVSNLSAEFPKSETGPKAAPKRSPGKVADIYRLEKEPSPPEFKQISKKMTNKYFEKNDDEETNNDRATG